MLKNLKTLSKRNLKVIYMKKCNKLQKIIINKLKRIIKTLFKVKKMTKMKIALFMVFKNMK